jgi:hypothetical protein
LVFEWLNSMESGLLRPWRGVHALEARKKRSRLTASHRQICRRLVLEPLEERALLSATAQFHHIVFSPSSNSTATGLNSSAAIISSLANLGTTSPSSSAFTPQQIRAAYGIDLLSATGAGQTIAIIDAYHDPNIISDLHQFDLQFGLPDPPSFQVLNQNGGTDLSQVPTDPAGAGNNNWEGEEALDVEWAHAIAPAANIVLIEAFSSSTADLISTAVNTARNLAGVSVISMSFGASEYSGETSLDSIFTTPSGHSGVTFVASTGDGGSPGGYPAFSPNVVAVGGTSLYLSGGSYSSEAVWSSEGRGQSSYESKPSYQSGLQSSSFRQIPDVVFDADPNTGVAVYDSYNGNVTGGPWYQFGGTSLSAPCWAGLIALADQLRVNQGLTSLDGPTQTLPKLYSLSAADFHKITSSTYDDITGLGSPVANTLVVDLGATPKPDLTITKVHTGSFLPGAVGDTYTITVTNSGTASTSGTVSVVDTLPSGLTATAISGSGWSVNLLTLTATRSDALAAGGSYPALTVTVNVAANAPSSVTNTAVVSGGGEANTSNDTATDPTFIGLPAVTGVTPSLSGGSLTAGATTLAISFNETVVGAGTASNYQLQNAGPDGVLGSADDVIVSVSASYAGTTATLTFAPLVENVYRLTVKDTITDGGGVKLDGNGDGQAGGNLVSDFVVLPSGTLLSNVNTFSSVGTDPLGLAVGDFNGDGKPDLAAANNNNNTVQVFLGDGKGGFSSGATLTSGINSPYTVAVGDFNGDGKADIAVANYGNNTVGIFLGNGSGGFTAGTPVAVGTQPIALAIGDFNGDGKADIAVANYGSNTVGILSGNGSGGFTYTSISSGGTNPRALAAVDFNGDGKLDIAVANYASNNVAILLGNGSGGFSSAVAYASGGSHPRSIAIGDFNGDGRADIAVGNYDASNVGILINSGSGTFPTTATTYSPGGTNPRSVVVADFNGDGKLDVAVANNANGTVGVLLGTGSGGFASATTFSTNNTYGPFGMAVGDLNLDGLPDLVVANSGASTSSNSISTMLDFYGPSAVTFNSPHSYTFDVATDFFGPGEFIQGTNNAFDGFGRLMVGGVLFRPSQQTYTMPSSGADSGQSVTTAAGTAAGLTIYRKITVPNSGSEDFARTVDYFTNSTGSDITTTVQIVGNLGSGASTAVFATSTGNASPSPADQWFGVDGGTGPALIFYLHSIYGLQPASVTVSGDNVVWTYSLTVPAGQTRELGYFTIQAGSTAQAIAEANALVEPNGFLDTAALGLGSAELADMANFQFNQAPAVTVAAAASPNPATTTTTSLSVLGADDGGESNLTYTWSTTGTPPAPVTFSTNGTNAAKNTTATFTKAGAYAFTVTISDAYGLTTTSTVNVTVNQTPKNIAIGPSGGSQFTVTGTDQFGNALPSSAAFAWPAAGLTLQLSADGNLHIYQSATTADVVSPYAESGLNSVTVTGLNGASESFTLDLSAGKPIPAGGITFTGGTGGGNSLFVIGALGGNSVVMSASEITDNGSAPIYYSNVAYFGFNLTGGSNSLAINNATLKINQNNAISAGTNVTINAGVLDLNGKTDAIGSLVMTSGSIFNGTLSASSYTIDSGTVTATLPGPGTLIKTTAGQASIAAVNNTNTTISAGSLSVNSLVTGTLTLAAGTTLTIAAIPGGPSAGGSTSPLVDASAGQTIAVLSNAASAVEPITTMTSASAVSVARALQQAPASVSVEDAASNLASNDPMPISSVPISATADAGADLHSTTSANIAAPSVKSSDSQSVRQIYSLAADSSPHRPTYGWFNLDAAGLLVDEWQLSKTVDGPYTADLSNQSPVSTQDKSTFRRGETVRPAVASIGDASNLVLHAAIQDLYTENSNGLLYSDLFMRVHSQRQIEQFAQAVDSLLSMPRRLS